MRTDELDYVFPPELIATEPASPRDAARLLVVSRTDESVLEHRRVRELPAILGAGDRLILNRTRVVPARLVGRNLDTGGTVQGLYLRDAEPAPDGRPVWIAMLKARRFREGRRVELIDGRGEPTGVVLTMLERAGEEAGAWRVAVEGASGEPTPRVLARVGCTPLPPYILSARREREVDRADETDRASYQTVYAAGEDRHSVAAPTAGLHFTPGLFDALDRAGVERREVTLAVGAGTFKPVETDRLEDHDMHAEWCSLAPSGPGVLDEVAGRRIAVGTTSARTLETFGALRHSGQALPESVTTDLLIAPGHAWRGLDGLMTNFHQPRSTLIALVASLFEGGAGRVRDIYARAIEERYRLFSFGDAMLILP